MLITIDEWAVKRGGLTTGPIDWAVTAPITNTNNRLNSDSANRNSPSRNHCHRADRNDPTFFVAPAIPC